jgi:hypothetical protein
MSSLLALLVNTSCRSVSQSLQVINTTNYNHQQYRLNFLIRTTGFTNKMTYQYSPVRVNRFYRFRCSRISRISGNR